MEQTTPRPVTTTRLMGKFLYPKSANVLALARSNRRGRCVRGKQNPQVLRFICDPAVDLHHAVGNAQHQLAHDDALEVDDVGDEARVGLDHIAEFDFAHTSRASAALSAHPAQEE